MAMNPYDILGIPEGSPMPVVKRAYRKKARENHPDLNPGDKQAAKRMNEINEAYDRIVNPDKYAAEDARRAAAEGRSNTNSPYGGTGYSGGYGQKGSQQSQQGNPYQGTGDYGWAGDFGFGFEDLFGGYAAAKPIHPEAQPSDSPEVKSAINMINNKDYKQASKVLYTVPSTDRNARWYYIIALANNGMNNTMLAIDQIKKAVEMDPSNNEYKNAARVINSAGRTYQQTGTSQGFSMNFGNPTTILCCMCLAMQCLGGGCYGFRMF